MERWRPVVGFRGRYMVSSHGRVRRAWKVYRGKPTGEPLKIGGPTYPTVCLCSPEVRSKIYLVHHLVAFAFLGFPPGRIGTGRNDWQVHHIDENKRNNRVDNLVWIVRLEHGRLTVKSYRASIVQKWFLGYKRCHSLESYHSFPLTTYNLGVPF